MIQADEEWAVGCDNSRHVLTIKDLATGLKMAYPMPTKSSENTIRALDRFIGRWPVGLLYSDNSPEIADACHRHGFPRETSHSGVP